MMLACQIAELENDSGEGEKASQTLAEAMAENDHSTISLEDIPAEILLRLETLMINPLVRWFALQPDEVDCILHLWRGNILTALARVPEAIQAYHETETRLRGLPDGLNTRRIWLHWAKPGRISCLRSTAISRAPVRSSWISVSASIFPASSGRQPHGDPRG